VFLIDLTFLNVDINGYNGSNERFIDQHFL